jgi:uncharacterized protein
VIPSRVVLPDGTALPIRAVGPPAGAAARGTMVVAHGAGSHMAHPSVAGIQERLARGGLVAVTFDFPYRVHGRGAPDRMPVLAAAYAAVLDAVTPHAMRPLAIGGRSLGGRVASHVAADGARVDALVFLAFPLHPPGHPGVARAAHLARITAPMLFVQGTRDTFAREDLLSQVLTGLPRATLHSIADADHGFRVPKRTGRTDADVQDEVADTVVEWMSRA